MKKWSDFYNDLMPDLPGCSTDVVDHALLRASQDFCNRSRAWRVTLDPISVAASDSELDLLADGQGQEVVRIEWATYNDKDVDILAPKDLIRRYGPRWASQTGTPQAITQLSPLVARLCPVPDTALTDAVNLVVSLRPADSATGLDNELVGLFREAIVAGVKGRLMLSPKKPYTDLTVGGSHAQAFEEAICTARFRADKGFGTGRVRTRAEYF